MARPTGLLTNDNVAAVTVDRNRRTHSDAACGPLQVRGEVVIGRLDSPLIGQLDGNRIASSGVGSMVSVSPGSAVANRPNGYVRLSPCRF